MVTDPQETFDALSTVLGDEETFQKVVTTVFQNMDVNGNGAMECNELGHFLARVCAEMGVNDPPDANQVHHVFKHLDLNGDDDVSKDELEAFLRHLFGEQLRQAKETLTKLKAKQEQDAKANRPEEKAKSMWLKKKR